MSKKIVFTFGRFNPPTTGHYLLASRVKQEALRRSADHRIYGSSSYDKKRNPLNAREKLRFMKKVLKGFNVTINNKIKTPYDALSQLDKEGYTDVVFVVGGDRVSEFSRGMKKYIGPNKLYKFEKFEVISAGERDPDAENVQGMSASKMRGAAKEGNLNAFRLGVPSHVSTNDANQLFKKIQTGMGVKPFIEENWFDYDEFVEFLEEGKGSCSSAKNMLKKFDMSGEGIDIPAIDNKVWGPEGIKKSAKKKKVKRIYEYDELDEISTKQASIAYGARVTRTIGQDAWASQQLSDKNKEKTKASKERLDKRKGSDIKKSWHFLKGVDKELGNLRPMEVDRLATPKHFKKLMSHIPIGEENEIEEKLDFKSLMQDLKKKMKMTEFDRKERSRLRKLKKEIRWYNTKILGLNESNEEELNEISIQARRKMARSAKRTAKRRMRKRKMKEKRKKSGAEIKKKAQKAAVSKIRARMIKGMNWNELSFSQRENIEQRLKKKKTAIAKLAKRLVPQARKAEQERLKKVRAKMTTNDPAKAVENFEIMDHDFENFIMEELPPAQQKRMDLAKEAGKKIAKKEDKDKEIVARTGEDVSWKNVAIVRSKSTGKISIVKRVNNKTHTVEPGSEKGKVTFQKGKDAASDKATFAPNNTSRELLAGLKTDAGEDEDRTTTGSEEPKSKKKGEEEESKELTPAQQWKAEKAAAKLERDDSWENLQKTKEFQAMDGKLQKALQTLMTSPKKIASGSKYPTDFPAVLIEAGMVIEFNRMQGLDDSIGNVSEKDMAKVLKSMTLISSEADKYGHGMESAASRAIKAGILPFIKEMDPEEKSSWRLEHSGSGMEEGGEEGEETQKLQTSQAFQDFDAKNATPKSDILIVETRPDGTEMVYGTSIKAGAGQLMSPAPGEAMAIFMGVMGKQNAHCTGKGKRSKLCKSIMSMESGTREKVEKVVSILKEEQKKGTILSGAGVGPFNWFSANGTYNCGASKGCDKENPPKWWNTYGPGSAGVQWKNVFGERPEAKHWKGVDPNNWPKEITDAHGNPLVFKKSIIKQIEESSKRFGKMTDMVNEIFNESPSFKDGMIHEAMTGCIKFCGCCEAECDCNNAVASKYFTMNPDGTNGNIRGVDDDLIGEVSDTTKFRFDWKGGQRKITVGGKEIKTGNYGNYPALRSGKMNKEELESWKEVRERARQQLQAGFLSFRTFDDIGGDEVLMEQLLNEAYNEELSDNKEQHGLDVQALDMIDGDPFSLMNWLDMEVDNFSTNEIDWPEIGSKEPSNEGTEIQIDGKSKMIPISKYKPDSEEESDEPLGFSPDEWQQYDKLSKGAEKAEISNSLKGGMTEDTIQRERQKKNVSPVKNKNAASKINTFAGWSKTKKEADRQQQNIASEQYFPYEFKDSSIHGIGTFATNIIKEGEGVGLYYLSLLSENENAPEYQRTDFCRFTNHSWSNPNLILIENQDGNFYTHAIRDINEGEELFIDYFNVFEMILPALKEEGLVIPEVLKWTIGNDIEIPPDDFDDLTDELRYFTEINEAPPINEAQTMRVLQFSLFNIQEDEDPIKRAKRQKEYNAKPEQRANRSKRTLARQELINQGRVAVGDGNDVHHRNGNPSDNSPSNLQVMSANTNRGLDNNKWRDDTNEEHGAGEIGTEKLLKRYIKDTPFMSVNKGKK